MKTIIMNLITINAKALIIEVAKATVIEKAIMIGLWVLPIPLTLEAYLIIRTIIKRTTAKEA